LDKMQHTYICPRCGLPVMPGGKICDKCGVQLTWPIEDAEYQPAPPRQKTLFIVSKRALIIILIAVVVILAIIINSAVTSSKIALSDAPYILNMAENLPPRFLKTDAAQIFAPEKIADLGTGASGIQLFISNEPYQVIYSVVIKASGFLEQAYYDGLLKDDKQFKDYMLKYLRKSATEYSIQMTDPSFSVSHPSIGDICAYATGTTNIDGEDYTYSTLIFKKYQVYILTVSLSFKDEASVSIIPIGNEIIKRMDTLK